MVNYINVMRRKFENKQQLRPSIHEVLLHQVPCDFNSISIDKNNSISYHLDDMKQHSLMSRTFAINSPNKSSSVNANNNNIFLS